MFYFYVLYSLKDNRLYKGASSDLPKRILQHNAGMVRSTKNRRPLILLYFETFDKKSEAFAKERWAKSLEGGPSLKKLLIEKQLLMENGILNLSDSSAG